jgi:flagellar biosynthesis/type III secretory pathway chaperone
MQMNALLDNLLQILKAEISFYQSLQSILQQQRQAIINCEVKSLKKTAERKEAFLSKSTNFEAQRTKVMAKLAEVLAVPQSKLTLKKIIRLIQEPYASELRKVRAEITAVLEEIRKTNQDNLELFRHSHRLVQSSLALLNKCILNGSVYYPSGKIQNVPLNGTLLSGEI